MNTKAMIQIGIALIFLAIAAFIYPNVTATIPEKLVEFGPVVQAIAEIKNILPMSPLMGGLVLAGGILLVVVGVKNSS